MKKRIRAKYFVREHYDRPVSKKEYLRLQDEEIEREYIKQTRILNAKALTVSEIRKLEKSGVLKAMRYRGKKYFEKDAVSAALSASKRSHQLRLL